MIGLFLLMVFGLVFCLVILPYWWWLILVPFWTSAAGARSAKQAFLVGALSGGLVWAGYSLYLFFTDADLIAERISRMFSLPSPALLILLTTVLAAVAAALAATAGYSVMALLGFPLRRKPQA